MGAGFLVALLCLKGRQPIEGLPQNRQSPV